jgi:hypothetical protein
MTSDDYFLQRVLPHVRADMRSATRRLGRFRGQGRIDRRRKLVEFIFEVQNPLGGPGSKVPIRIVMGGSYIVQDDGDYTVFMNSPYFSGTHEYHERMYGEPQKDAATIVQTTKDMITDYTGIE